MLKAGGALCKQKEPQEGPTGCADKKEGRGATDEAINGKGNIQEKRIQNDSGLPKKGPGEGGRLGFSEKARMGRRMDGEVGGSAQGHASPTVHNSKRIIKGICGVPEEKNEKKRPRGVFV